MRRQEYIAVLILVALVFVAWFLEHSKEKDRRNAPQATEQSQQTTAK